MYKRNTIRKYFTLILMFFTVVIGFSSWVIVGEKNVTLGDNEGNAVAYISSNSNIKYTRIEKALEVAKDGDTVYVIPGSNPTIYKDCIIKKGVTLTIPFANETYNGRQRGSTYSYDTVNSDSDFADAESFNNKFLQNTVTVKENVEILIEGGRLNIGGILGGEKQVPSGHTSGNFTQILMGKDSKIIVVENGIIDCMGYIKEDFSGMTIDTEKGNGSSLLLEEGTLYNPFVIYDYRGGNNTVGVYQEGHISPFSVFDCPNVQIFIQCNYGSNIIGYADLFTGETDLVLFKIPAQHNVTDVTLVGVTNAVINLNPNTILYSKYISSNPLYTVLSNEDGKAARTKIRISGTGANLGAMSLSVSVMGSEQNVSTKDVLFPISYRYDIELESGIFDISYDVKCLPGFRMIIGEEATLNINSNVILYSSFADGSTIAPLYPVKIGAIFKNNGSLNINTAAGFGGIIEVGTRDAILNMDITDPTKFKISTVEGNGKMGSFTKTNDITEEARGIIGNEKENSSFSRNIYFSNGTSWYVNNSVFKYYLSFETNEADEPIANQSYISESPFIILSEYINNIIIPKKKGYKFLGWYLDSTLTEVASGVSFTIVNNEIITLFAKWEKDLSQVVTASLSASKDTFNLESTDLTSVLTVTAMNIDKGNLDSTYIKNITWNSSHPDYLLITKDSTNILKANATIKMPDDDIEVIVTVSVYDIHGNFATANTKLNLNGKPAGSGGGGCLLPGTLVTMADGTKKPVEQVQPGEMLKVFNHYTGEYDVSPVVFNDSEPKQDVNVINLEFSNGSNIGVVYEHGFFDLDLMKYVYIDEYNYNDYVGHRFYGDDNNIVTLNRAYITTEYTEVYSPVTAYHLNYFTEDILSMPGGIEGLFNIFEYDYDLKYNEELMKQDIETYGLYTYDDFKDYCSYEFYQAFPAEYLKVAVGKGYITFDEIIYLINRYKTKV